MEITKNIKNDLMQRREIQGILEFEKNPSFAEVSKILADEFKVRIEMRQIGARQEAGRLGGIGSCGRELCCDGGRAVA